MTPRILNSSQSVQKNTSTVSIRRPITRAQAVAVIVTECAWAATDASKDVAAGKGARTIGEEVAVSPKIGFVEGGNSTVVGEGAVPGWTWGC